MRIDLPSAPKKRMKKSLSNPRNGQTAKYVLNKETKEITEEQEGVFKQYPVKLAWGITIHKSQGLTFEHAIIDARSAFAHGQAYVALSRCKTLEDGSQFPTFRQRHYQRYNNR